jgi:hypothetical protein
VRDSQDLSEFYYRIGVLRTRDVKLRTSECIRRREINFQGLENGYAAVHIDKVVSHGDNWKQAYAMAEKQGFRRKEVVLVQLDAEGLILPLSS